MWCRTILTAVAISYVICVLLLNGLQKEDLDASTLEKLRRHNVNIYDMNNESLRQACLLNSNSDTGNESRRYETTEVVKEVLEMSSTTKSEDRDIKAGDYLKLELKVPESYENKTIPNGTLDINTTANFLRQLQTLNENLKTNTKIDHLYNLENVTKIEEHSGLQIEYMQNHPTLENVLKFWTKLTHNTKKVVTKVATTPPCTDKAEMKSITTVNTRTTNNNGYVHSREMEYISRIIAEYLVTETAPTTTQVITTEPYIKTISRQIGEFLRNTARKEQTTNGDSNQTKDLKLTNKDSNKQNYDVITEDVKSKPYKMLFEENEQSKYISNKLYPRKFYNPDSAEDNKSIHPLLRVSENSHQKETPYTALLKVTTRAVDPEIKSAPTRFLDHLLEENNNINGFPNNYSESSIKNNQEGEEAENDNQRNNMTGTKRKTKISNRHQDSDMSSDQEKDETKELKPNNEETAKNRIQFLPVHKGKKTKLKVKPKSKPTVKKHMINMNDDPKMTSGYNQTDENRNILRTFNPYKNQDKVIHEGIRTPKPKQDLNFAKNNFHAVLPSIKAANKKKKSGTRNNKSKSISAEIIRNFEMENNEFKKLEIDPKTVQKYEKDAVKYGGLLPSIKVAKINKNAKNKSNQQPTEINGTELLKNFGLFNEQYKAMQVEANKSKDKKITRSHNNNPEIMPPVTTNDKQNITLNVDKNQFKNLPAVIKHTDRIQLSRNQLKILPANLSISEQNQQLEINNEQLQPIPVDVKNLQQFQNFGMNMNEPQVIPADVIKEIAEKVKQLVLRDMGKNHTVPHLSRTTVQANVTDVPTTYIPTTTITTTTMTTTTEPPSTPRKEPKEENQVIKKLMEMFNELKNIKESTKVTTVGPLKTTSYIKRLKLPLHTFPPILAGFNPYVINTPPIFKSGSLKPMELSPYGPKMVPIPISSGSNLPKHKTQQYPPNPHKNPKNDLGSGAITIQTNSDEIAPLAIQVLKPMRLMNQHIIVTTTSPKDKRKKQQERASKKRVDEKIKDTRYQKEKFLIDSEFMKKIRLQTDKHEYYNDRLNKNAERPKYTPEFPENVQNVRGLNHAVNVARPTYRENGNTQNKQGYVYPREFTYTGGLSNLGGMSYPGVNHARGYSREQAGLNDKRPYMQAEPDRLEPQYSATKFHEQLERIENWPRNTWFKDVTENCCEEIAPRKQVSLAKLKQRTRFDDTHFTNFLKSQQKVTDMLERILASNTKSNGPRSVELP